MKRIKTTPAKKAPPHSSLIIETNKNTVSGETELNLINLPSKHVAVLETGLVFDKATTFEEWQQDGVNIANASKRSVWMMGDWLNFGSTAFKKEYQKAIEMTGWELQTLRNIASVCKAFPPEKRTPGMSFEHHRLLAPLTEPERAPLIERAVTEKLSAAALRLITPKKAKATKPKTQAQIDAEAKADQEKMKEKASALCTFLPTLSASFLPSWATTLAALHEATGAAILAYEDGVRKQDVAVSRKAKGKK